MMAAVDVPAYPESSMDQDDMAFPCKGCGEILDEGKAFELAGSRWHIDCFRCNTCGTLLDSDAHLLLLGDGSLICNNCTYSCSSCGSKIEDLAILTGDQAFCANCFKCRNCKNRIENLRYARTSQGIFCMDCHESLMQRRRKKNRAAPQAKRANPTGIKLDKSLPSLPQSAGPDTALSRESEKESAKTYPTSPDESARSRAPDYYTPSNKRHSEESVHQPGTQDNIILPSSTYRSSRHSVLSNRSDVDGGDEFLIPVAFDPTTEEPPSRAMIQDNAHPIEDVRQRDRVGSTKSGASSLKLSSDRSESLAETSPPHIAYQEKGRQPGDIDPTRWRQDGPVSGSGLVTADRTRPRDVSTSQTASHRVDIHDTFKLQDPPKGRKSGSARSSKSDLLAAKGSMSGSTASSPDISNVRNSPGKDISSADPAVLEKAVLPDGISESPRPSNELGRPTENGTAEPARSFVSPAPTMHPKRGDSLEDKLYHTIIRKELGSSQGRSTSSQCEGGNDTPASVSTVSSSQQMDKWEEPPKVKPSGDTESLTQKHVDPMPTGDGPPDMAPEMAPETAPEMQAQSRSQHGRNASISIPQSERPADANALPSLLRYSAGGDFSMDEDMARILGADENPNSQNTESFLRRVSNSVRHGRSFSDKGSRFSKEPKWPKSPVNGVTFGQVISSPSRSSPDPSEEVSWLRSEIRRERQRLIEKDQKISELEAALNSVAEVKQVNTELREKRSTMVVLDARKEIVLRELSVLTEHLEAEKHGGAPMDLGKLTNNVIRRFAESLQQLKDSFAPQIEELMQKRNDMVEELSNLSRMKDKSFQEFEQLSCKNAELAEFNNDLVHQIQGLYKANSGPGEATRAKNGLGLSKEKSTEVVKTSSHDPTISSATTQQEDAESATVVPGPQVVSIHKGQPRKFWKKGGQTVAKGVAKGLKGAFLSGEHKDAVAYHSTTTSQDSAASLPRSQTQDPRSQGFGFFVNQRKHGMSKMPPSGSSPALAEAAISAPAVGALFGTELEQRLEQEKCIIPAIVTRCIQEVELRGMDVEGIYRKSGAASVVQAIREGFERSPLDYDISDPDLDIHAVTSALKQYLRKLPTPLITYEVYDQILDSNETTSPSARVEALRRSLHNLPRVHKDVLEFLVFHLKRVVEHEKENLMSSMNVAVVFAPTILRPETLAREMTDVQKKNEALKFLIDNCQETFMEM